MAISSQEIKTVSTNESLKQLAGEKASASFQKIGEGLKNQTITPALFLDETRVVLDHMHALPREDRKNINKAFAGLRKHGKQVILEQIKPVLLEQINDHTGQSERKRDLKLAEMLGLIGNRAGIGADKDISKALGPDSPVTRRRIKSAAAAGLGAALLAAAGRMGFRELTRMATSEALSRLRPGDPGTTETEEPGSSRIAPDAPKPHEPDKKPEGKPEMSLSEEKRNYYEGLLKPLLDAIYKNRQEKALLDPEFLKRIDWELNQDRINIVVYSHGEALEVKTDQTRRIGSFSTISLNLKTGRVDKIAWTHDLRSPETERALKEKGIKDAGVQKMYHAYTAGGTELLGKAAENISGLTADLVLALPEDEAADLVDNIYGTLTVDVPGDFETYPYYYKGQRYPADKFKKGPMVMDGATIVKYIKTEAINPTDPAIVNSNRKNKVIGTMLKQGALNFYNEAFWDKIESYMTKVKENKKMDSNLDPGILVETVKNARKRLSTAVIVGNFLSGNLPVPEMASSTYIVSDHFGDGGLEWAVNSSNPIARKDFEEGLYTGDSDKTFVQIPLGGNPYAADLARDYYGSIRRIIRRKLGFAPLNEATRDVASLNPEPADAKEALASSKQEKWGFMVSTPEAIEALPPSIGIIRIDGDSNLMYPDGRFHHNPDHYYEEMLNAADKKGLRVIFAYKASWFPGVDERTLKEGDLEKSGPIIRNHLRAILKHPCVKYFEVGNEIDQNIKIFGKDDQFWEGSMEDYAKLFKLTADNLEAIRQETGSEAELIISSFADPTGTYEPGRSEEYFRQLTEGLKANGIDPSRFLIAGHAYHLETLRWILDNLQQKTGAKGVIITEYNVNKNQKDPPPESELAEMVRLLEEREDVIAIAHEFKPKKHQGNNYALIDNDPRLAVIMDAASREAEKRKQPNLAKQDISHESESKIVPRREGNIHSPAELSLEEFKEWEAKHKNPFDSVITESLFTKELGFMTKEGREEALQAIARAHAKAIVEHYGDTDAIIGLDPGHGVWTDHTGDVGSATRAQDGEMLIENQVTWKLSRMIAQYIMELSEGKYDVVILRPEHTKDRDMNGDGAVENWDRIRPRKTLLAKEVAGLRPDPADWDRDVLYCSIHLNGSENPADTGTEVYYPHAAGVEDPQRRLDSKAIAEKIQNEIVNSLHAVGYPVRDRGVKEDSGPKPYVALRA